MGIKQFMVLVVTVLCLLLAHTGIHNVCTTCNSCQATTILSDTPNSTENTSVATTNSSNQKIEPIIFNWNDPKGLTSSQFTVYQDSIANSLKSNQQIEVFGYYFKDESIPEGYDNMGFARADALIERLSSTIPTEKMQARAQMIPEIEGVRNAPFISTNIRFIDTPKTFDAENTESTNDVARVDEVGGRALIYFPFNSTQKITNQEIDDYLDQLSKQVIKTGERVYITGHTDNVGSEVSNIGIGRARARAIRDILRKKGVPKSQIRIDSKGKSEPTAPNNSDANRALNRRVEVEIQ